MARFPPDLEILKAERNTVALLSHLSLSDLGSDDPLGNFYTLTLIFVLNDNTKHIFPFLVNSPEIGLEFCRCALSWKLSA